jgi:putative tricarboxylic transport membrane protein
VTGMADRPEDVGEAPPAEATDVPDRHTVLATAGFGALMLVLAVLVVANSLALPATTAVVGPAAVPLPLGVLLGVLGALLLVRSRTQLRTAAAGTAWEPRGGLRVLALVVVLVAFALLLPVLGYVVSSAALFVAAALLLGAPRGWKVVAYGWALAGLVFLVFDRLIGLTLPAGPWGF